MDVEQGSSLYRARVKFTHQSKHYYFGLNELCRKSKYRSFLIKRGCNLSHYLTIAQTKPSEFNEVLDLGIGF